MKDAGSEPSGTSGCFTLALVAVGVALIVESVGGLPVAVVIAGYMIAKAMRELA